MSKFQLKRLLGWVFIQVGMKCETKAPYRTALLEVKDIVFGACSCQLFSMNSKIVLFSKTFCQKAEWLLKCPF